MHLTVQREGKVIVRAGEDWSEKYQESQGRAGSQKTGEFCREVMSKKKASFRAVVVQSLISGSYKVNGVRSSNDLKVAVRSLENGGKKQN